MILEYLDETQPAPLHPADSLTRAEHRAWMEFGSQVLGKIWGFVTADDAVEMQARADEMRAMFQRVEAALGDGPYFSGADFSLVDAVFGPVFRYFDVFDRFGDFGVLTGLPKVQAWREALRARSSVKGAVGPDYADRLIAFIQNRNSALATRLAA